MKKRPFVVKGKTQSTAPPERIAGRRCQRCGAPLIAGNGLPDYTRRFCASKQCKNQDRSEQIAARSISGRSGARCPTCRRSNKPIYVVTQEGAILAASDPRTAFQFGRVPGAVLAGSRRIALMWARARKQRLKEKEADKP